MRLLNSITGLAGDVAEYVADRIDHAAENVRGEAPGATDWEARAIEAEGRVRVLEANLGGAEAELDHVRVLTQRLVLGANVDDIRLPSSTTSGKLLNAIVQLQNRNNDGQRQLEAINRAIASVELGTSSSDLGQRVRLAIDTLAHRAHALQGELNGMHHRERQVDQVIEAWDVERGNLKGYDRVGALDPETPAGRVVELLSALCKVRPTATESITANRAALDAIYAELGEYGLLLTNDGDYSQNITEAVRAALASRAEFLQQLRTIDNALTMYDDGRDPITMCLKHPLDTAGRVVEALSVALKRLRELEAEVEIDDVKRLNDALRVANRNNIEMKGHLDRERARNEHGRGIMADRIRAAAAQYEDGASTDPDSVNDIGEAAAYVAGMEAAACIAAGETAEADPNVDHIDTVNGRGAHAQATDERPVGAQVRHPDPLTDPQETE